MSVLILSTSFSRKTTSSLIKLLVDVLLIIPIPASVYKENWSFIFNIFNLEVKLYYVYSPLWYIISFSPYTDPFPKLTPNVSDGEI